MKLLMFVVIFFCGTTNCMKNNREDKRWVAGDIRLSRSTIMNSAHELVDLTPYHIWSYDEHDKESDYYNETTPLARAVSACDVAQVQTFLKAGADPNDKNINIEQHKKSTVRCKQCVELILAARKLSNE